MAHLIEIALWAVVFVICGEFHDFGTAYYHSAVNYTTLGYGDLIMSSTSHGWPLSADHSAEQEFADSGKHFAEDRTKIIQQAHSTKRRRFWS